MRRLLAVVAVLVVGAAGCSDDRSDDSVADRSTSTTASPAVAGEWERLDDLPLAGRATATTFWVAGEFYVVGGDTFTCPPGADCGRTDDDQTFADGAALDPATGTWRTIAAAPFDIAYATVAVVGADAFLVTRAVDANGYRPTLLRYASEDDAWSDIAAPDVDLSWYDVMAIGTDVLVFARSDEHDPETPDLLLDPESGTWSELRDDPLGSSYDRQPVWAPPNLYLLARPADDNPGSEPPLLQVARLDVAAGTWEQLPDSDRIGYGPWLAEDGEFTSPDTSSADGGQVDNWGRNYFGGGTYDIATGTWRDLPPLPDNDVSVAGAFGNDVATWSQPGGQALDLRTDTWVEVPRHPQGIDVDPVVGTAGRDLVAVTGHRYDGQGQSETKQLLSDTWIWRAPP